MKQTYELIMSQLGNYSPEKQIVHLQKMIKLLQSGTNRPDEITDLNFRVLDLQQTLEDPKMLDHRMLRKNYLNICGKTKSSS